MKRKKREKKKRKCKVGQSCVVCHILYFEIYGERGSKNIIVRSNLHAKISVSEIYN